MLGKKNCILESDRIFRNCSTISYAAIATYECNELEIFQLLEKMN